MKHKKFMVWIFGIPVLIVFLMIIIVLNEPEREGISRAAAYKAAALLIMDREELEILKKERERSYFTAKEIELWYVKYIDFLYEKEYISETLTPANKKAAEGALTYAEADYLARELLGQKNHVKLTKKNQMEHYPKEEWWRLYSVMLENLDQENKIMEADVLLYGTPLNINPSDRWTAYTSHGDFKFEGLGLDYCIDKEIKILYRGSEIITVKEIISDTVTYKNAWLTEGDDDTFRVFLGSVQREFPMNQELGKKENLIGQLADLHVKGGKLQKLVLKKERITGRVLSVTDDIIEIEKYGSIPLDDNFKVYQLYGTFRQQKMSDILVGYDMQEFVVADGKLCAALTVRPFEAKTIRVLLMNTGFQSIYHPAITLSFEGQARMTCDDETTVIESGTELSFTMDDKWLKEKRVIFEMESTKGNIILKSVERAQGIPAYGGRMELKKTEDGLILINEVFTEDYLKKVVPSEMPHSYEMEALKAQAVCARTYAYKQVRGSAYSQYGAHVDDSTGFQVYNNIETNKKCDQAVDETYGKLLLVNGEAAEAFYFSTSCGHTTDGSIWGSNPSDYPYLQGVLLRDGRDVLNLTMNATFSEFIRNKNYTAYDSTFPLYRWETEITNRQLESQINDFGTILNATVIERGIGGIAKKIHFEGPEGEKIVSGQNNIRAALGNTALTITKNDGKTITGWSSLPSAFIDIAVKGTDDNNVTTFKIYGGGYGHGVGMSQNGAQGMAQAGKNYMEILEFFFAGSQVEELLQQ